MKNINLHLLHGQSQPSGCPEKKHTEFYGDYSNFRPMLKSQLGSHYQIKHLTPKNKHA